MADLNMWKKDEGANYAVWRIKNDKEKMNTA
jgi:hypothetical protein